MSLTRLDYFATHADLSLFHDKAGSLAQDIAERVMGGPPPEGDNLDWWAQANARIRYRLAVAMEQEAATYGSD